MVKLVDLSFQLKLADSKEKQGIPGLARTNFLPTPPSTVQDRAVREQRQISTVAEQLKQENIKKVCEIAQQFF